MENSYQNVEFIFGENNNYHQIGNGYLEFDITVRRNDNNDFDNDNAIRLTNNALAYVFKESRLSTTSGLDLEHNKFFGQVSTIMRCLTSKDGDLLSQFDNMNEEEEPVAEIEDNIKNNSLKKMLSNNQTTDVNKGKIKSQLVLEHKFGFCETFKNVSKNLGFHLTFKTADREDFIYTTLAEGLQIKVTINSL